MYERAVSSGAEDVADDAGLDQAAFDGAGRWRAVLDVPENGALISNTYTFRAVTRGPDGAIVPSNDLELAVRSRPE